MIWEAAHRGRLEMVRWLAERGADLRALGGHFTPFGGAEVTPWCAAKFKRHNRVADELDARGAGCDLHAAAYLGIADALRDALDAEPARLEEVPEQWLAGVSWLTPLGYALAGPRAFARRDEKRKSPARPMPGGTAM